MLQIEALLSLDGAPVILDRIRLPAALFPDMTREVFSERDTTIYALYQSRYDITVVRIEESITAAIADARVRALLRLADPAPVLRIARTAYAHRDVPVDARVRYVRTTHHRYLSVPRRALVGLARYARSSSFKRWILPDGPLGSSSTMRMIARRLVAAELAQAVVADLVLGAHAAVFSTTRR